MRVPFANDGDTMAEEEEEKEEGEREEEEKKKRKSSRNIPGRHFSCRNAESLRSRGVTIETPEMFLPVPRSSRRALLCPLCERPGIRDRVPCTT